MLEFLIDNIFVSFGGTWNPTIIYVIEGARQLTRKLVNMWQLSFMVFGRWTRYGQQSIRL
jgi:hypothetical protein